jgi:hypothetical protein
MDQRPGKVALKKERGDVVFHILVLCCIGARKREDLAAGASTLMHSLELRARVGWSPGRLRRLAAGTIRLVIGKDIASAARRR